MVVSVIKPLYASQLPDVKPFPIDAQLIEIMASFLDTAEEEFAVVDEDQRFVGMCSIYSVFESLHWAHGTTLAELVRPCPTATLEMELDEIAALLKETPFSSIPLIDSEKKLITLVSASFLIQNLFFEMSAHFFDEEGNDLTSGLKPYEVLLIERHIKTYEESRFINQLKKKYLEIFKTYSTLLTTLTITFSILFLLLFGMNFIGRTSLPTKIYSLIESITGIPGKIAIDAIANGAIKVELFGTEEDKHNFAKGKPTPYGKMPYDTDEYLKNQGWSEKKIHDVSGKIGYSDGIPNN